MSDDGTCGAVNEYTGWKCRLGAGHGGLHDWGHEPGAAEEMSDSAKMKCCHCTHYRTGWRCTLAAGHVADHEARLLGDVLIWPRREGDECMPAVDSLRSADAADDCPARCPARYGNELGDVQCQKVEGHDGLHECEQELANENVVVRRWGDEECVDDGDAAARSDVCGATCPGRKGEDNLVCDREWGHDDMHADRSQVICRWWTDEFARELREKRAAAAEAGFEAAVMGKSWGPAAMEAKARMEENKARRERELAASESLAAPPPKSAPAKPLAVQQCVEGWEYDVEAVDDWGMAAKVEARSGSVWELVQVVEWGEDELRLVWKRRLVE